jgi:hypothetical protein
MRFHIHYLTQDYYQPHPLFQWMWHGWRRGVVVRIWSRQFDIFWGRR